MSRLAGLLVVAVSLAWPAHAGADGTQPERPAVTDESSPADDGERRHVLYLELLGKTGLYGVGYEYHPRTWLQLGTSASVWNASGATMLAISPYFGVGHRIGGDHRWFAHIGPSVHHHREPAVAGWDGLTETGIGGQISLGYELRRQRLFFRASALLSFGGGGWIPWLGLAGGVRL